MTDRCTLNCEDCSNLMPYYKEHKNQDYSLDAMRKNIDAAASIIDFMFNVRILGGEPFLNPNLSEIIQYCLDKLNIDCVHIVTNGTIVPRDSDTKLIEVLKNRRVIVYISNYGSSLSRKTNELKMFFEDHHIRYVEGVSEGDVWYDMGEIRNYDDSEDLKKSKFTTCGMACHTYIKGKAHYCPRSAFGEDLGYFNFKDDRVDFLDESISIKDKRKKYCRIIYENDYINACGFCGGKGEKIEPAIQCK